MDNIDINLLLAEMERDIGLSTFSHSFLFYFDSDSPSSVKK